MKRNSLIVLLLVGVFSAPVAQLSAEESDSVVCATVLPCDEGSAWELFPEYANRSDPCFERYTVQCEAMKEESKVQAVQEALEQCDVNLNALSEKTNKIERQNTSLRKQLRRLKSRLATKR